MPGPVLPPPPELLRRPKRGRPFPQIKRPRREARRFARNSHLAEYLGVSLMTLWRWKRDPALGFPPASLINGVEWNDLDLVDDWMAARAVRTNDK